MFKTLKYQSLSIIWAFFILLICCISLGKVGNSHLFFRGFDKLTHTGLFFVLTVLTFYGLIRKQASIRFTATTFVIVFLLMFAFGGTIEILQWKFFTYRSGDWNDLFCDVLGSLMGIFSIIVITNAIQIQHK